MSLHVLHVHLMHLVTLLLLYLLLPLVAMVTGQTTSECECEVYPPAEADGTGCIRGGFQGVRIANLVQELIIGCVLGLKQFVTEGSLNMQ